MLKPLVLGQIGVKHRAIQQANGKGFGGDRAGANKGGAGDGAGGGALTLEPSQPPNSNTAGEGRAGVEPLQGWDNLPQKAREVALWREGQLAQYEG